MQTDSKAVINNYHDLVIIGGGPVGMALALALHDSKISVTLLEARGLPEKTEDTRPLALSHSSRLILQRLGVWDELPGVTPITTIHISNRGGFGRTLLTAHDVNVPALGYVVNHHDLFRSLHKRLRGSGVNYLTEAQVTHLETTAENGRVKFQHTGVLKQAIARLLVLADGGCLATQIEGVTQYTQDYKQWAIVTHIKASLPQCGRAYERFTPDGPVALLPMGKYFALVWTVSSSVAQEIINLDDTTFLTRLYEHFGDRLGKFIGVGKRSSFPLILKYVTPITAQRIALIGNAAQTLHPVAGQGFNLGLRDAWELANEIIVEPVKMGTPAMLSKYNHKRQIDRRAGRIFTDSLVKIFSNDIPGLRSMRGIGLSVLDCMPLIKRSVTRRMIFGTKS